MFPGNIFGLILKNKMAARDVYSTLNKDFCWSSRAKGIIGRDLKFAGYVPHYKILTGNIFGLILKNKMAATGVSLSVMKSSYISLIIGLRGLVNQPVGNHGLGIFWCGQILPLNPPSRSNEDSQT